MRTRRLRSPCSCCSPVREMDSPGASEPTLASTTTHHPWPQALVIDLRARLVISQLVFCVASCAHDMMAEVRGRAPGGE